MLLTDALERRLDNIERLLPLDLAEAVVIAQHRLHQPVVRIDVSPGKLALDAR